MLKISFDVISAIVELATAKVIVVPFASTDVVPSALVNALTVVVFEIKRISSLSVVVGASTIVSVVPLVTVYALLGSCKTPLILRIIELAVALCDNVNTVVVLSPMMV